MNTIPAKISQERIRQVIVQPLISEKTTSAADKYRQHSFRVLPDASKSEIKQAVEALFDVKVEQVQVANMRGKAKDFARTPGKRKDWKKAHVRLKEGDDIDFLNKGNA